MRLSFPNTTFIGWLQLNVKDRSAQRLSGLSSSSILQKSGTTYQVSSYDGRYFIFRKSVFEDFRFRYDTITGDVEEQVASSGEATPAWVPTEMKLEGFRYVADTGRSLGHASNDTGRVLNDA